MLFRQLDKYRNLGLFILRFGIGICFMIHGYPKLAGGPAMWAKIGGVMSMVGISFAPAFWGFMAAFSEFFGGLLLLLGFFFRPANLLLFVTMVMATTMHFAKGDDFNTASHALELGIVFLSLIFVGPGAYSLDEKFGKK